ncbi:MAG: DUF6504 family protein [Candidatus Sumerlaeota bacterium]|nr:DUF6504 family protein [Candidatus Sumerlaeota bacterium]
MPARFVSEPIRPVPGTMDTAGMARGEPSLPERFVWREKEYRVAEILETWKDTGPCTHGSGERYVRRHWFRIRTTCGVEMKLYYERQPKPMRLQKARWWLFALNKKEAPE